MLRIPEVEKLTNYLRGDLISNFLQEDIYRLTNNFFGYQQIPFYEDSNVLILGARSGLEIVRFALEPNIKKIFVVESNKALQEEILLSLSMFDDKIEFFSNLYKLNSLNSYSSKGKFKFDYVRLDIDFLYAKSYCYYPLDPYNLDIFDLFKSFEISYLAGEIDEKIVNSIKLIRLLKKNSESYFLRSNSRKSIMSGTRSNFKYEVSVVVPCYAVLPWIDRCINSLLNQTIKSIEIIAVNDGSPDNTGIHLDKLAKENPEKLKVIHKTNGGCASARNAGIKAANGEFIGFVDADDWADSLMFEELYKAAVLNSTLISQCGYKEVFDGSNKTVFYNDSFGGDLDNGQRGVVKEPNSFLLLRPTIWRRIYSQGFLKDNKLFFAEEIKRFDDMPFQFQVFSLAREISVIPDCFYNYRQERVGQDIAVRDERLFVHFQIFENINKNIASWADSNIERELIKQKLNTYIWALKIIRKKYFWRYLHMASFDLLKNRQNINILEVIKIARINKSRLFVTFVFIFIVVFDSLRKIFFKLPKKKI